MDTFEMCSLVVFAILYLAVCSIGIQYYTQLDDNHKSKDKNTFITLIAVMFLSLLTLVCIAYRTWNSHGHHLVNAYNDRYASSSAAVSDYNTQHE